VLGVQLLLTPVHNKTDNLPKTEVTTGNTGIKQE
jgi:hypothetical protein